MTKLSVKQHLHDNNKMLGTLLTRLQQLNQWNAWLKECLSLDEPLTKHCIVVDFSANSLIVITDSAHWLARLRFHIPDLIKKLKKYPGLHDLRAICCKTQPPHQPAGTKAKKNPMQKLSAQTAASIQASAGKITDKKLKSILEKIALNTQDS